MFNRGFKRKPLDFSPGVSPSKRHEGPSRQTTLLVATSPPPRPPTPRTPERQSTPSNDRSHLAEQYGIVQRQFYPAQITNERCVQYNSNETPRPIEELEHAIKVTASERKAVPVGDAVVHWFKRDLRLHDNRPLSLASALAKEHGIPLICMFIVSPQDYQAHLTAPVRVDFELRTLAILKEELAALDIPLWVETIDKRKAIPDHIIELCQIWGANHMFCGTEYEVDELRREALLTAKCLENGINFTALHDDAVVPPGALSTGHDTQFSVFSPWYKAWVSYLQRNPDQLDGYPSPSANPLAARINLSSLFEKPIPIAPRNKSLSLEETKRFNAMWPAGEAAAHDRLTRFLNEKIAEYKGNKNFMHKQGTAILSVHLASGTLAARTAVRLARDLGGKHNLDTENSVFGGWIAEIAWRDFYKHVLAHWPYVCMNKPFKYEYTDIEWEYDQDLFRAWCEGKTGFPVVDAGMRQLNYMGYMHNRARMITASFLAKDLLLDWRMGEKYFMEHLVDGDFASNNGGWGFSASTGVDPQPFFRIFNPLLQSEKFDPEGEYIRKWVPELKEVEGKAIHDPYGRGAGKVAERNGYPKAVVDHKESRVKALERIKRGLGRSTP
jgi:deoxyribodipyrimidine photo-lyase